jgi:hypothetical protein
VPSTYRFPIAVTNNKNAKGETNQIIQLAAVTGVGAFPQGGEAAYGDVTPWHLNAYTSETPYCDVVLEFTADGQVTIGDGTSAGLIGLYGQINSGVGAGKFLLGIIGIVLAGSKPQIPIFSSTVGFSQIIAHVPIYDKLSVGGVMGAVDLPIDRTVTVRARPIRTRSYPG